MFPIHSFNALHLPVPQHNHSRYSSLSFANAGRSFSSAHAPPDPRHPHATTSSHPNPMGPTHGGENAIPFSSERHPRRGVRLQKMVSMEEMVMGGHDRVLAHTGLNEINVVILVSNILFFLVVVVVVVARSEVSCTELVARLWCVWHTEASINSSKREAHHSHWTRVRPLRAVYIFMQVGGITFCFHPSCVSVSAFLWLTDCILSYVSPGSGSSLVRTASCFRNWSSFR
jgi:hypothetical protein